MLGQNPVASIASKSVLSRITRIAPDCIERTVLAVEEPAVGTLDLSADQRAKVLKAVKRVVRRIKFRTFLVRERLRVEIFFLQVSSTLLQILRKTSRDF
jgi:hypothetical protein